MSYHVCLDPGHGVETPGKCAPDKSYYEHEFALDLARRMKAILERHGVAVTLTRTTEKTLTGGATNAESYARVAVANGIKDLDLFVSLHSNAAAGSGWSSARGLLCITSAAGESAGRNKAARAILRRMEEAGVLVRSNPLIHESGYIVLRETAAPAIIVEHGFHTNREDVALLKSGTYRDKLAVAECKGVLDYLGVAWKDAPTAVKGERTMTVDEARKVLKAKAGLSDATIEYLWNYRWGDDLLVKLAKAMEGA